MICPAHNSYLKLCTKYLCGYKEILIKIKEKIKVMEKSFMV